MELNPANIVITDASVLINFLAIGRTDLIQQHPHHFLVTDHVAIEITREYPEQQTQFQQARDQRVIEQITVNAPEELNQFARLHQSGRLGKGECSAIAVGVNRGYRIAIDDKAARNQALSFVCDSKIVRTQDLIVELIRHSVIDVSEADKIKSSWAAEHRFRLKINSFQELL